MKPVFITSNKLIVIIGPNASGKSEFAARIAKKFNGEIISADSRQVYRNLNIGSGKVEGRWKNFQFSKKTKKLFIYKNIIHHCIDFVNLKQVFSAGDFKKHAEKAISEITKRGKIPIICGGTGFYIDALLENIKLSEGKPNWKLRHKLEKKSREELFAKFKKINPEKAKKIDRNNKRRLIRAIEIKISRIGSATSDSTIAVRKYDVLYIGITHPTEILRQRINHRLKERLKNGMIEEVRDLHFKHSISWKRLDDLGLEYRYISYYLRKKIKSKEELAEILNNKIWQYAKRQLTWFKKNNEINWISLSEKNFKKNEKLIKNFIS